MREKSVYIESTFAQEYLNQKHVASCEITEINIPQDIKKMFDIILKLNGKA